jgi:Arc/MetJ-type ribon-helix-helix transcriptional regulator
MMATIPIQLNDVDLKKIDYLVKSGRYKNRSQAIKSMIQEKLTQEVLPFEVDNPDQDELMKKILHDLREKKISGVFTIDSDKSAAELISEDRDR